MITPVLSDGRLLGLHLDLGHAYFFFGSRHADRAGLERHFAQYNFCFLKQVHGNRVVEADPTQVLEADGHITAQPQRALMIQTADCVPILLANRDQVCALHAGWRGVVGNIVAVSARLFRRPPSVALLGPHIRSAAFEIGLEVRDQLLAQAPNHAVQLVRAHADAQKCYFDLAALVKLQLHRDFSGIQVYDSDADTFGSSDYCSFRRDRGGAGRQFSFVVMKA